MPRAVPPLDAPSARARLPRRREPYWAAFGDGGALGYRRGARGGTWVARRRDGAGGQRYRALGVADDPGEAGEAGGDRVLSYGQAVDAARAWFAEVGGQPPRAAHDDLRREAGRLGAEHDRLRDRFREALDLWRAGREAFEAMPAEAATPAVLEAALAFLARCEEAVRLAEAQEAACRARLEECCRALTGRDGAKPDRLEQLRWHRATFELTGNPVAAYRALRHAAEIGAPGPAWAVEEALGRCREVGRLAGDDAVDPDEAVRLAVEALGRLKERRNRIGDERARENTLVQAADHEHEVRHARKHGRRHKGALNRAAVAEYLAKAGRRAPHGAPAPAKGPVTARTREEWRAELRRQWDRMEVLRSEDRQ